MSLAQLIVLFDEKGRNFTKTDEGTLELVLRGKAGTSHDVTIREEDGWVVAQAYLSVPLIPKINDLALAVCELYRGHLSLSYIEGEIGVGEEVEILIESYLVPGVEEASLKFFGEMCERLCPYLVSVAERGLWDPKEFPQLSPFSLPLRELN